MTTRIGHKKATVGFALAFLATGCVTAEVLQMDQVVRPERSPNSIVVFREEPQRPYTVIATIDTRGETVFDGSDDLRRRLIIEAAQIGGDAVILSPESTESNLILLPTGFLISSDRKELSGKVIVFSR